MSSVGIPSLLGGVLLFGPGTAAGLIRDKQFRIQSDNYPATDLLTAKG